MMEWLTKIFEVITRFTELTWYSKAVVIIWPLLTLYLLYGIVTGHLLPRSMPSMSNQELRNEAIDVSREILEFLTDRKQKEPQVDFNNWDESTNNMLKYSSETPSLYMTEFGSKVVALRDEFKRRELSANELDMLCEHATNSIVIEMGAIKLGSLAYQLP